MNAERGLERCLTFINCQLQPGSAAKLSSQNGIEMRAVTISREAGAGGHLVAEKLADYLQVHSPKHSCPWTVFDRNLVQKVLDDHHLPARLARFMPEDRISEMTDTMDELFGLHPPSSTLVRKTADTILRLAELGHVILIGRAANLITSKLDYVFHVRLVGSLAKRVKYIQELNHWSTKAALEFVHREDRGRRRYLKKYFGADIENPLLYHLVINTDWVDGAQAARMISQAMLGDAVLAH